MARRTKCENGGSVEIRTRQDRGDLSPNRLYLQAFPETTNVSVVLTPAQAVLLARDLLDIATGLGSFADAIPDTNS